MGKILSPHLIESMPALAGTGGGEALPIGIIILREGVNRLAEPKNKEVEKHRKDIIAKMKAVNTYNKSFEHSISVLAKTIYDYENALVLFERSGGSIVIKHTNKNGSTNVVKNPLYLAIEKLRDDVLAYARELGLTPAGLNKINDELARRENPKSKLATVLNELNKK